MKTKNLLQTTGLTLLMVLLVSFFTHAQIPVKGLVTDNEGVAIWDADGTGPEPEGYAHIHPWTFESSFYYAASRDYVDANPDAALGHFTTTITDFPLFEQALSDNGFTPEQVRIKYGLTSQKGDNEGEDWFTIDDRHYYNRYDGNITIELDGEPMISAHVNFNHISKYSGNTYWETETNFSTPIDVSGESSQEVKNVAAAFLNDVADDELRLTAYCTPDSQLPYGNGRTGYYVNIDSGYIEKGLPQLPFTGLASDHEGIAAWNADGSGPEPENYGHTYSWGGSEYQILYYNASRDYDDIDPDPGAGLGHFTGDPVGFPNLMVQLEYRGYTLDQLQLKSGLGTLGNDAQGFDWDLEGNIHWWNSYGNTVTFEVDGEPIIEYVIDTNFNLDNMSTTYWYNHSTFSSPVNISEYCSSDAQFVAHSFFNDLSGHSIRSYLEGIWSANFPNANGRVDGRFDQLESSYLEAKQTEGTHLWSGNVSGTWTLENSPYVIMGKINIPDDEKLTIEPGVVVKFNTKELFRIYGCLEAIGNLEEPILFTALDSDVRWGGLFWDETPTTNETSVLKHCIFEYAYSYNLENQLGYNSGGAIAVVHYDSVEISHCLFRYNRVDKPGEMSPSGGAMILDSSSIHISHCIFHDNKANHGGAISLTYSSNAVIDNCLFYNNEALDHYGGAVVTYENCSPSFINCTFADNYAFLKGGAIDLELGGTTTLTNCILWGNDAGVGSSQISIWEPNITFLNIYFSDIEEGVNGIEPGFQGEYLFNIESSPEFCELSTGTFAYTLLPSSPCLDAGTLDDSYLPDGWSCPGCCLCGNPRVSGDGIDMGCYELTVSGIAGNHYSRVLHFDVFPNPLSDHAVIDLYMENDGPVQISIMDVRGRVVKEIINTFLAAGNKKLTWNSSDMPAGVYICNVKAGNRKLSKKLVKLD